jgi:hypothetical protein
MIGTYFPKSYFVCENDVCGRPSDESLSNTLSHGSPFAPHTYYAVDYEDEGDEREVDLHPTG